jgi:hypothetical protein
MRRELLLAATAALAVCGCGKSFQLADVKGRVTLNNKPLANVVVSFQPEGKNPGPGSSGITDSDGRYTLKVSSQQHEGDGAIVGTHRVMIGVILPGERDKPTDPEVGTPDGATPEQIQALRRQERIPARYNQNTELRWEVKPGQNEANFDLKKD